MILDEAAARFSTPPTEAGDERAHVGDQVEELDSVLDDALRDRPADAADVRERVSVAVLYKDPEDDLLSARDRRELLAVVGCLAAGAKRWRAGIPAPAIGNRSSRWSSCLCSRRLVARLVPPVAAPSCCVACRNLRGSAVSHLRGSGGNSGQRARSMAAQPDALFPTLPLEDARELARVLALLEAWADVAQAAHDGETALMAQTQYEARAPPPPTRLQHCSVPVQLTYPGKSQPPSTARSAVSTATRRFIAASSSSSGMVSVMLARSESAMSRLRRTVLQSRHAVEGAAAWRTDESWVVSVVSRSARERPANQAAAARSRRDEVPILTKPSPYI